MLVKEYDSISFLDHYRIVEYKYCDYWSPPTRYSMNEGARAIFIGKVAKNQRDFETKITRVAVINWTKSNSWYPALSKFYFLLNFRPSEHTDIKNIKYITEKYRTITKSKLIALTAYLIFALIRFLFASSKLHSSDDTLEKNYPHAWKHGSGQFSSESIQSFFALQTFQTDAQNFSHRYH